EVTRQVGRSAAEKLRHIEAAATREIKKSSGNELLDDELVSAPREYSRTRCDGFTRKSNARNRSPGRKNGIALEAQGPAAKGPLERCRVERIADHRVAGAERKGIHCAAAWHSGRARPKSAAILDGQVW